MNRIAAMDKVRYEADKAKFLRSIHEEEERRRIVYEQTDEYKLLVAMEESRHREYIKECGLRAKNPDKLKRPEKLLPVGTIIQRRKGFLYPEDDSLYILLENDNGSAYLDLETGLTTASTGLVFAGEYKTYSIDHATKIILSRVEKKVRKNYTKNINGVKEGTAMAHISAGIHALGVAQGRFS